MDALTIYLADCIAATAHDFDKKSASKHERRRHRELCEKVANMLDGKLGPPAHSKYQTPDQVAARLRSVAVMLAQHEAV